MAKRPQVGRQRLAVCSCLLIISSSFHSVQAQSVGFLRLSAVEGEGAFNSIKSGFVHPPAVRVTDESDNPVAGAEVRFTFPAVGPGAILPAGGNSLTAKSDETGLARCPSYKPNIDEGRFRIKVEATFGQKTGMMTITQSNTRAGGASVGEEKSHKGYWIAALVAAGAVGSIFAFKGKSSSSPGAVATPTTLTSGTITVGGPR